MKEWTVIVTGPEGARTRIAVDAPDEWRAVLAAGRTGHMPMNVQSIEVQPFFSGNAPGAQAPQWP